MKISLIKEHDGAADVEIPIRLKDDYYFKVVDDKNWHTGEPTKQVFLKSNRNKKLGWELTRCSWSGECSLFLKVNDKIYTPEELIEHITELELILKNENVNYTIDNI